MRIISLFTYILLLFVAVASISKAQYSDYEQGYSEMDMIVDCLANNGVVLYGSPECGRTKSQIKQFGGYLGGIPFVNCKNKRNRAECKAMGVGPYPHWSFPSGYALGGHVVDPYELAEYAGCFNALIEPEITETLEKVEIIKKEEKTERVQTVEDLAICLANAGVVMYGSHNCPHCEEQMAMFGMAFDYISFVDCSQNQSICRRSGVQSYPQWNFPSGDVLNGTTELYILAEYAGCF